MWLWLSIASAAISWTVSESYLFAGLRAAIAQRSSWWGYLVSCGYCIGHWVALALVLLCRPQLDPGLGWLNYPLAWLIIAFISGLFWAGLGVLVALRLWLERE